MAAPDGSEAERLAVLAPVGEVFVNGLACGYDEAFPADSALAAYMTRAEFDKALAKINEALLDHWPCLPCTSFAYGCCLCTLGLSFYCAASQVREAEARVRMQLRRINEQRNFADRGVEWRLVRKWYRRTSWVEIWHVSGAKRAPATGADPGDRPSEDAGAVQDEAMDRVV